MSYLSNFMLMISASVNKLTGSNALLEPETIRKFLNLNPEFEKNKDRNVFPILALYDRFIEFKIQKKSYDGHNIKTIEAGHVTGALSSKLFRAHCIDVLNLQSDKGDKP